MGAQNADAARSDFAEMVSGPDEAIDLARAALCVAAEAAPGLDIADYLNHLDELAESIAPQVRAASHTSEAVNILNEKLFESDGFRGNEDDYYDPRNSFLNDVIDRRCGIPISLSILYIEVARRAGLKAEGIGFPGHFLARVGDEPGILVDVFHRCVVSPDDCAAKLRDAFGPDMELTPDMLEPTSNKRILQRLLSNLKQIYVRQNDLEDALGCSDRILLLDPEAAIEVRDRGLLYQALECHAAAQADLERFLEMAPGHDSTPQVLRQVTKLRSLVAKIH
jgi:regulator of sirC expression with transglutaminase-like and TPR domain